MNNNKNDNTPSVITCDTEVERLMTRLSPHTVLFSVARVCEQRAKEAKETRPYWPDCLLQGIWSGIANRIEDLAKDIQHGRTNDEG